MGKTPYAVPTVRARLTRSLSSPAGRQQYRRGEVGTDDRGTYVDLVGGAGSHLVGDLASADCLIVVPPEVTAVEAGETVEVLMLEESR
jgi:molybdopterin molybdotransferase